jgi:alkylated DNA nucleotide flippase Atl1
MKFGIENKSFLLAGIYSLVGQIPKGKVATYGRIAKQIQIRNSKIKINPRLVGHWLHKNPDPQNIPCHRVVDAKGKLAEKFAFGGWQGQKKKLAGEGVTFINERTVDLNKHLIKFRK